jgi:hypothetical protein
LASTSGYSKTGAVSTDHEHDFTPLMLMEQVVPQEGTGIRAVSGNTPPGWNAGFMSTLSASTQQTLLSLQGRAPPKFSGKQQDWLDFSLLFKAWMDELSGAIGFTLPDPMKLCRLTPLLDRASEQWIQTRREKGEILTFSQVWARLQVKFGALASTNLKSQWDKLTGPAPHQLTWDTWNAFVADFDQLRGRVPGLSEQEQYDKLTSCIPYNQLKSIIRQEHIEGRPMARMEVLGLGNNTTELEVARFLQDLGLPLPDVISFGRDHVLLEIDGSLEELYISTLSMKQLVSGGVLQITPSPMN